MSKKESKEIGKYTEKEWNCHIKANIIRRKTMIVDFS